MDELVSRLSEGRHPVELGLRPERSVAEFRAAIERGLVHIRFTGTRGGTELGVRVDRDKSSLDQAVLDAATGTVHVEGTLTLNYVRVRCIADIDLGTLAGKGHLVPIEVIAP